jgi:hypothetical protein
MFRKPVFRHRSLQVGSYTLEVPVRGIKDASCKSPYVVCILGQLFRRSQPRPRESPKARLQRLPHLGNIGRRLSSRRAVMMAAQISDI